MGNPLKTPMKKISNNISFILKEIKVFRPAQLIIIFLPLSFFYTYVLQKEWNSKKSSKDEKRNPLSCYPIKRRCIYILFNATTNLKHKAILMLIYGSGLRVSEVARLKISDICSKTMRIRVDHAKHNTHRYTILSQNSLEILREYFKKEFTKTGYKPERLAFSRTKQRQPLSC